MAISGVSHHTSLRIQSRLDQTNAGMRRTIARLTTGRRINESSDDAAGLAAANRHRLDYVGLQAGIRSANDAVSRLQIEDGAMSSIATLLDRALTLAAQSVSGTFLGSRTSLDGEYQSVLTEIDRTATAAGLETYNANLDTRSVFVGNSQVNTLASVTYASFSLSSGGGVDAIGLGLNDDMMSLGPTGKNITDEANARLAIARVQSAMSTLGTIQSRAGAAINRLQFAIAQAQTTAVSVQAAESRIRDADIAVEAAALVKYNILNQSGLAALAQANQAAASVSALLGSSTKF